MERASDRLRTPFRVVRVGDCLGVMRTMPDRSLDALVTDPPYGIGFMGRAWDKALPDPAIWREALRVVKPGAHGIVFGGTRVYHRLGCHIEDAGWEIRDCGSWLYGQGFPKSHNIDDEHGTALKPAWEPWFLVRAPFNGTVERCYREHGTGVLNIDACRINASEGRPLIRSMSESSVNAFGNGLNGSRAAGTTTEGRWPANVILDEEAGAELDKQTGISVSRSSSGTSRYGRSGGIMGNVGSLRDRRPEGHDDEGGASRFFYCAKASRSEREAGLEHLPAAAVTDGRVVTNDTAYQRGATLRRNTHPTVKPIALMRYLVRLVTPPGGAVLDPFTGSGTTGIACALEGVSFVGVELDAHYAEIARARIACWSERAERQPALFNGDR